MYDNLPVHTWPLGAMLNVRMRPAPATAHSIMAPVHRSSAPARLRLPHVPWRRGWLLLQVLGLLALAQLAVRRLPFRRLAPLLGTPTPLPAPPAGLTPAQRVHAEEIAWAIAAVGPRTPWRSHCLPQALAARWLLARRHIPATLYLGAALLPPSAPGAAGAPFFAGHAWLCCGSCCVTGGPQRFAPLAAYT
jgi:hypothetical protein